MIMSETEAILLYHSYRTTFKLYTSQWYYDFDFIPFWKKKRSQLSFYLSPESFYSRILRQLWQGLPFLPQVSYMRRMLLRRESSFLLDGARNRHTFASSKPRQSKQKLKRKQRRNVEPDSDIVLWLSDTNYNNRGMIPAPEWCLPHQFLPYWQTKGPQFSSFLPKRIKQFFIWTFIKQQ